MKTLVSSVKNEIKTLQVSSDAFENGQLIPIKYTCDGENINPPLKFEDIPEDTKCLAIITDDPDAHLHTWTHWIVWNIYPAKYIKENNDKGIEGLNDYKQHHYCGPCPPMGTHHYRFKVYALDCMLSLNKNISVDKLEKAMNRHIIAFGELTGLYKRANI